jgi:serine O-acetyltransferase
MHESINLWKTMKTRRQQSISIVQMLFVECLVLLACSSSLSSGLLTATHPRRQQTAASLVHYSTTTNNGEVMEPIPKAKYTSPLLESNPHWKSLLSPDKDDDNSADDCNYPLWEQIKLEGHAALGPEPEAGPQIYQAILSQPSLTEAIVSVISHEIENELIRATELHNLFLKMLTPEDECSIENDVIAAATRSPSIDSALMAVLHNTGLHALVCYRVGHRLWQAERKAMAYYLQSTVSRRYSADIHPACRLGSGIYLKGGAGVVIGETAVTGNDVSILHGVTLGGTGKERGDRHPKIGHGVILQDGASVLGNIVVGDGAVVTAKAIVTKPVEPLAVMTGVPAKFVRYRSLDDATSEFHDDLSEHLIAKYLETWKKLYAK